jgi:murein DD-endopeptidase MepM/ murein hydrolase activator NlpD
VKVAKGDTWSTIAKKNGISVALLERINQRSRLSKLTDGDQVVVYTRSSGPMPIAKPTVEDSTYDETAAMLDAPNAASAADGDPGPLPLITED